MTRREMLIESAAVCLGSPALSARGASRNRMRVCLLIEPGLPSDGAPSNLEALLTGAPQANVSTRDSAAILKQGIDADVFCNSHGSVYPGGIGERIFEFLAGGGRFFHVGGIPFDRAVARKDGRWVPDEKSGTELREKLGMHRYVPAFTLDGAQGLVQSFEPVLIGMAPGKQSLPQAGINITTTMPVYVSDPSLFGRYSVAYLSKPVCRHTHIAGQLEDPAGRAILSSILLTKTWRNPYEASLANSCGPWVISTAVFDGPLPADLFSRLWAWLACPTFLGPIELETATLRPGERTTVKAPMLGALEPGWEVSAQVATLTVDQCLRGETPQWTQAHAELVGSEVGVSVSDEGRQDAFLFAVRFLLADETGRVRDYTESAVAAWRPEAVKSGPRLRRNRSYLDYAFQGQSRPASFLIGTNWGDSEVYGLTWHNPNPLRMAADARSMAKAGLRVVRVHYTMPESLRVLNGDVFRRTHADFFRCFESGPELTERHLRALEAHAMVFGRMGIVFMPSVYTNVGPSMGNAQIWKTTSERYEIPDMIEAQKVFAHQVMDRLGALPSITWDLINEPDQALPTVGHWLDGMRPVWGRTGQLVGVGTFELPQNLLLGEAADWHSIHGDCTKERARQAFHSGKPNFYHEAWAPTPSTPEGEEEVEQTLSQTIARTIVRSGCGFMPWGWNKILAYWRYGVAPVEIWDHDLGACTQGEGVRRRGWFAERNWAILLDGVSFDQSHMAQIAYIYPKLTITGDRPELWLDILHKRGLRCLGINDGEFESADLSRTRLVIIPHYGKGYRSSTYQKVFEFARQGGVVWAHADSLRRDENGKLEASRNVLFTGGRVAEGKGAAEWYFGWSIPDGTSARFEKLLRNMELSRPATGHIPVVGGEILFTEDKEFDSIRTVQITNGNGDITRAWSGSGDSLSWPRIRLSSPGQLFVVRKAPDDFRVYGERVRVAASGRVSATIPEHPGYGLAQRTEAGETVVEPSGWQRAYWFELRFSS